MQVITDQVLAFSKDNAPCATAQPGEVLLFKTQDCFAGRIPNEDVTMKDLNFSYGFTNPAAGPVYIEGAEPGDVLVVDIYDVQVADHGVIATDDHCGPLYQTTDYRSKIIPIEDGMADFNGVKFPIDPMIGVIGTAPDGEDVIDGFVGAHGGNLDNKLITKGTRMYFPVRVPGALLQMGDVHATMGDAELCGTGIEIAGRMCLRVTVYHDRPIERPVIETADSLYFLASRPTLDESIKLGTEDTVKFLMKKFDINFPDAYRLLSATCDVQISEVVDDNVTIRIRVPKFDNRVRTL